MPDAAAATGMCVVALGGNMGDVAQAFVGAVRALDAADGVRVACVSPVYRTPAWGRTDQPDFLNAAVRLETHLAPLALLDLCLSIEQAAGRVRHTRWGPRTLDLDLIVYGSCALDTPRLTLPHARAAERAFVLVPLADVAPGVMLGGARVEDLLARVDRADIQQDAAASARLANWRG